jgi:hypothetical protein
MTYTAAFEPKVIRTYPRNLAREIPAKANIVIDFSTDLDRDYIDPYIQVFDADGKRISGVVSYNERSVTFTPGVPFTSFATVRVLVVGDDLSGKGEGIRSVLGERMRGNFDFSFTVAQVAQLPAPELMYPADQSIIDKQPVFDWNPISGAAKYHIEVSQSNTMSPVLWPAREDAYVVYDAADPLSPDITFSDGIYYWRMRAVSPDGTVGEWSPILQFHIDTQVEGTVTPEDAPAQKAFVETEYDTGLEILAVFPEEGFSNVATNLKTIYVQVMGSYTKEDVQNSFVIAGERVDGDETDPELIHGEIIGGIVDVVPQTDGTTIITFELPELEV